MRSIGSYSKVISETGPGSEPPQSVKHAQEAADDRATVRLIKGRGVAVTFSSHFAIAVVGAAVAYFASHKADPISADVGSEARRCNESVTQLRADFTQFKAEQSMHNLAFESKMNELLARTWSASPGQPSAPSSQLGINVSRQLSR